MKVIGRFEPPILGRDTRPIPVVGAGSLVIAAEGLHVVGYGLPMQLRRRLAGWIAGGVLLLIGLLGLLFWGLQATEAYLIHSRQLTVESAHRWVEVFGQLIVYAVLGLGFAGLWFQVKRVYRQATVTAPPIAVLIPWSSIQAVKTDRKNAACVLITISGFTFRETLQWFNRSYGTLYFYPTQGRGGSDQLIQHARPHCFRQK